ncbi:hypothetical protein PMAYCL1PPCAC_12013, partial [Pristionchus mayeri]
SSSQFLRLSFVFLEMANVFNTFSFNKWADTKKEEEIDKESRKRRHDQIKRLKEKLRKERELRESGAGGDGEVDLEALIEALQSGEAIHADANPFENWHNGRYVPGTMRVANQVGRAPSGKERNPSARTVPDPEYNDGKGAIDLPDDYILEEIRRYRSTQSAHPASRGNSAAASTALPGSRLNSASRPSSEDDRLRWQFNRRIGSLRDTQPHSLPPSRSSSAVRGSSGRRTTSARPERAKSAERFNYNRYVTNGQRY